MRPTGANEAATKLVRDYGAGIRASSDLGSRKRRFEALDSYLSPVLNPVKKPAKKAAKAVKKKQKK